MTPNSVSYDTWRGVIKNDALLGVIWDPLGVIMTPSMVSYDTQHGVIWHPAWCLMTPNWCNVTLSRVSDDTYLVSYGTRHGVHSTFIWYNVHSYSAVDGCTAISFEKHVKLCLSKLTLFVLHDGICGNFHKKATIHASALHCVLQLKTWTKTVLTCFTNMIAEQSSLTQYEWPMYHIKDKYICFHPLIMIFLFDFERFRIASWFPFYFNSRYTHADNQKMHALTLYITSLTTSRYYIWHK